LGTAELALCKLFSLPADIIGCFVRLGRQESRDLTVLLVDNIEPFQCLLAAEELHTGAVVELGGGQEFHEADLTAMGYMESTAGTQVHFCKLHQSDLTLDLLFTPIGQGLEGLSVRVENMAGDVTVDSFIGSGLDLHEGRVVQLSAKVDGNDLTAHVEAYIIIAETAVDDAGDQLFPGMVLHEHKAAVPIDLSVDSRADL